MTLAYACVLIAALLPYAWTVIAKSAGERYDNRDPRGWIARQSHPRVHLGNAAQMNAFEAFPAFAASVLMAQLAGVPHERIGWLALVFVAFRVLHGVFYLAGQAALRSLVWAGGFACMLVLMVQAVLHA